MKKELIEYDVTTAAIQEMKKKYTGMKITDAKSDKDVRAARTFMVSKRTAVEKKRKELNEDANIWRKKVNDKAKEITALLLPIEEPLQAECKRIDDEIKAKREKKEAKERERIEKIQAKINSIRTLGEVRNVSSSAIQDRLTLTTGIEISKDVYQEFTDQALGCQKLAVSTLEETLNDRLQFEKEVAERDAETERLEAQRKEQEAAQAKIDEENRKIEEEKAKIEVAKEAEKLHRDREEFERQAKIKAEQEAKEKAEKAERDRLEKEAAEKEEKARQEALKPDKEKLIKFAEEIIDIGVVLPKVKSKKAQEILSKANDKLYELADDIQKQADKL